MTSVWNNNDFDTLLCEPLPNLSINNSDFLSASNLESFENFSTFMPGFEDLTLPVEKKSCNDQQKTEDQNFLVNQKEENASQNQSVSSVDHFFLQEDLNRKFTNSSVKKEVMDTKANSSAEFQTLSNSPKAKYRASPIKLKYFDASNSQQQQVQQYQQQELVGKQQNPQFFNHQNSKDEILKSGKIGNNVNFNNNIVNLQQTEKNSHNSNEMLQPNYHQQISQINSTEKQATQEQNNTNMTSATFQGFGSNRFITEDMNQLSSLLQPDVMFQQNARQVKNNFFTMPKNVSSFGQFPQMSNQQHQTQYQQQPYKDDPTNYQYLDGREFLNCYNNNMVQENSQKVGTVYNLGSSSSSAVEETLKVKKENLSDQDQNNQPKGRPAQRNEDLGVFNQLAEKLRHKNMNEIQLDFSFKKKKNSLGEIRLMNPSNGAKVKLEQNQESKWDHMYTTLQQSKNPVQPQQLTQPNSSFQQGSTWYSYPGQSSSSQPNLNLRQQLFQLQSQFQQQVKSYNSGGHTSYQQMIDFHQYYREYLNNKIYLIQQVSLQLGNEFQNKMANLQKIEQKKSLAAKYQTMNTLLQDKLNKAEKRLQNLQMYFRQPNANQQSSSEVSHTSTAFNISN